MTLEAILASLHLVAILTPTLAFRRWRRNLRSTAMLPGAEELRKVRRLVMVQSHILPVVAVIAVFWARGW